MGFMVYSILWVNAGFISSTVVWTLSGELAVQATAHITIEGVCRPKGQRGASSRLTSYEPVSLPRFFGDMNLPLVSPPSPASVSFAYPQNRYC